MPNWIKVALVEIGRIVRYLYFLRSSLTLWLFAWILTRLNETPMRSLISGIVTPEHESQYLCVAFFVVSAGFVALITARVVVINGLERFGAEPPVLLKLLLSYDREAHGWLWESLAVVVSQVPSAVTLWYLVGNGRAESMDGKASILPSLEGVLLGSLLAVAFWWVINATFYATYELPTDVRPPEKTKMGTTAARTILFPRWCFLLAPEGKPVQLNTLEGVNSPIQKTGIVPVVDWLVRVFVPLIGRDGYLYNADGRLYEAHAFSIPAAAGSVLLYLAMCPLTAPVPVEGWSQWFFAVFLLLPGLLLLVVFWLSSSPVKGYGLLKWKVIFTLGVGGFLGAIAWLYYSTDPERFPPFALVLIMVIAVLWTLSVIAFYADRYRIPVVTTILVLMLIPRVMKWDSGREEHYVSTAPAVANAGLKSPQEILAALRKADPSHPVIIVTATGGGLHASAWTAFVLAGLEDKFKDGTPFHDHLLLASSVSGGSVGLMTYLAQLQSLDKDQSVVGKPAQQMESAASCSSLEAAAWGLVYYDLPKAFVPVIPYFIAPDDGMAEGSVNDLDKSPLLKDRTWALRKGFARNLHNVYCGSEGTQSLEEKDNSEAGPGKQKSNLADDLQMQDKIEADEKKLTLASLMQAGSDPRIPAFSMNTTTVEGGTRFLLANYKMPKESIKGANESYPAESFLGKYTLSELPERSADLPLASAAQMSATFPYVSSAARIPGGVNPNGLHFVDGGYYDNDGTASAIEFLRSALEKPAKQDSEPESGQESKHEGKLQIIVVEIRNSPDSIDDRPQDGKELWNAVGQLMAPLATFWSAGHESVTERNRVGLDLFEKAYMDKVQVQRIVFADNNAQDKARTDPLNWSLTPLQREEVRVSAERLGTNYDLVKSWFVDFKGQWAAAHPEEAKNTQGKAAVQPGGASGSR